jgi:hypothetical protein
MVHLPWDWSTAFVFNKKKIKKKGGGANLKKKKGSNIGSCPQVPVRKSCQIIERILKL